MSSDKQTQLLEKIAQNTGPKQSWPFILTGTDTILKMELDRPIDLDPERKYSVALSNLETYYTFANITASNNKFIYTHDWKGTKAATTAAGTWNTLTIPVGAYEIDDLNSEIFRLMKANNHYDSVNDVSYIQISPNLNTQKSIITITNPTGTQYAVDFSEPNTLRTVLGFNSTDPDTPIQAGRTESDNIVNILSISSLLVSCNLVQGGYLNGVSRPVIYSFFPSVSPGFKIIEKPINKIYLPITVSRLDYIEVRLLDQNFKLLDLRGETLTVNLHIKEE